MFAKLHLLSQDEPEGGAGLRWRAHPYLRVVGPMPKGPAVFEWSGRQREDLEALWRDSSAEGARERLAKVLAAFCNKLGWAPDEGLLRGAEKHGDEYLLTLSSVPPELYLLTWDPGRLLGVSDAMRRLCKPVAAGQPRDPGRRLQRPRAGLARTLSPRDGSDQSL